MTAPLRVAVVETSRHGGLLHYAAQLADGLSRVGDDVELLAPAGNELLPHGGPAAMRAVLAPPSKSSEAPSSQLLYQLRRVGVAVRLCRAWARIPWEVRRGRYDAVVVGSDLSLTPAALGALSLSMLPRRPRLVVICHNVRVFNRGRGDLYTGSRRQHALLSRIYGRYDLVVVHGERSRAEFDEVWGERNVVVVPHGDERLLAGAPTPPGDEERILFFGDWRKVKGLPVLMDAFDLLVARRPSVRLTIAGSPAPADFDADHVRRWAAGHGSRVQVVDRYVPVEDVPAVLDASRVVVTPYLTGYQSGVVHLALTKGRAVVTTDVGDLPSAVGDGIGGRVVPPGDAVALADALEEVVSDRELAARLGEQGRRRLLERSSWEVVAQKVDGALRGVDLNRARE